MKDVDLSKHTKQEFKTFKDWFKLMNKNNYIVLFLLALVGFIYVLTQYEATVAFCVAICIPTLMMIIIAYKGFYKHWRDMQKNHIR